MNKIVKVALMMSLGFGVLSASGQSRCDYYIKKAQENVKKANYDRTGYMRDTYLGLAINKYLSAQSRCGDNNYDLIQRKIDQIESVR